MDQLQLYKKSIVLLFSVVLIISNICSAYTTQNTTSYMQGKHSNTLVDLYHSLEKVGGTNETITIS